MHFQNTRTRRKLFWSLTALASVLAVAAAKQFALPFPSTTQTVNEAPSSKRAVFGEPAAQPAVVVETPREQEQEREQATRTRAEEAPTAGMEGDIDQFIARWKKTILDRNVDGHTSLYAPRVEVFFSRRNVSRDVIRRERARMMEIYPNVNRYEISDIKIERATPKETVVSLRKEWDMQGDRRYSGAERQRLKLRRIFGDWKIVSEQEQQVYWTRRS